MAGSSSQILGHVGTRGEFCFGSLQNFTGCVHVVAVFRLPISCMKTVKEYCSVK